MPDVAKEGTAEKSFSGVTDKVSNSPELEAKELSDREFKDVPAIRNLAYQDHLAKIKNDKSTLTAEQEIKLAAYRQFKDYPLIADLSTIHAIAKRKGEQSSLSTEERALVWSYHEFKDLPSIRDLAYLDNLAELKGERKSPLNQNDQDKLEMYRTLKFDPQMVELAFKEEQGEFLSLEQKVRLKSHKKYGELKDLELRGWAFEEAQAQLENSPTPLNDSQRQFMQIERNLNKKMQNSMQRLEEARYWGTL